MKGIKDYLREGFEVKSSHADAHGYHWMIMQKDSSMVMVKLPMSMWSGNPSNDKPEQCWEISG